jgi:D-sedoheptulose 7-phosphate isomerase
MQSLIETEFRSHIEITSKTFNLIKESIEYSAEICIKSLQNGGKILLFGNGGSASDAQHIASELVGRFNKERKGLPAIALTTDSSALTSIGNDFGFLKIFERQVEALANKNDVVVGISTGGSSMNVINGLNLANKLDCKTIGFSGKDGGTFNSICDVNLVVPSYNTARIQEMHIVIGHTICHLIDNAFSDKIKD